MRRSFQIVFMMSLCFTGCQTKVPQSKEAEATASELAAKQPKKPPRPAIGTATARQDCVYYTSTADGKMAIGGSVKMGTTVRVLQSCAGISANRRSGTQGAPSIVSVVVCCGPHDQHGGAQSLRAQLTFTGV